MNVPSVFLTLVVSGLFWILVWNPQLRVDVFVCDRALLDLKFGF